MGMGRRVRRTRRGDYALRLPKAERELLRRLPAQMRDLLTLGEPDPATRRLFPPAYADAAHAEHDAEYQRYMHDDLVQRRLATLAIMEETLDAERLDEAQLTAWMTALNDVRLVLGTRLDVSEDAGPDLEASDPRSPSAALYSYLGWLQEQVVEALSEG